MKRDDQTANRVLRLPRGWLVGAVLCVLLSSRPGQAEPVAHVAGEFLVDVWTQDDGVPCNSVTGFAQGSDGYLWMISDQALSRFDGERFVEAPVGQLASPPFEWEGRSRTLGRLFQGESGAVWLSTSAGDLWRRQRHDFERWFSNSSNGSLLQAWESGANEVLALTRSGRLLVGDTQATREVAHPTLHGWVLAETVCRDDGGRVWFLTQRGEVARLEPASGEVWILGDEQAVAKPLALASDASGVVWLGTEMGLFYWQGDQFEPIAPPVPEQSFPVRAIKVDRTKNRLWIASHEEAWICEGGQWRGPLGDWPQSVPWQSQFVDPSGQLWLGTARRGLWCLRADGTRVQLGPEEGLTSDVTLLFGDREGQVWASLYRTGIARVRQRRFTHIRITDGLHTTPIWNLAQDAQGAMWLSAEFIGPVRWQEGEPAASAPFEPGLEPGWTMALALDRAGRPVLAVRGTGLVRYEEGRFNRVLAWPERAGFSRVLYQDRTERWWMGTDFGLHSWAEGRWQHWGAARGLRQRLSIRAITEDQEGRLWVGTYGGGLARLDDERFTSFNRRAGLAHNSVYTLCPGGDGSLWIGTRNGLGRWRAGRFTTYGVAQGLPDPHVVQILEDQLGFLWLGTRDGLCRVSLASIDELDRGRGRELDCLIFDRDDGLPTRVFQDRASPACWRARDGRLWFLTAAGAVYCDPDRIQLDSVPPPVRIEAVVLNGQHCGHSLEPDDFTAPESPPFASLSLKVPSEVEVPPGPHVLEVHYAAPSLAVPEKVSFEYRMEGLDRDWLKAGSRRVALYGRLPPGQYRFQVRARNHDGVWSQAGAELAVRVQPYIWQRSWFGPVLMAGLILLSGFGFAGVQRVRLQRQMARVELLRAKEVERTRISRDLHDHLGGSLTEIGMLAEDGTGSATVPAASAQCRVIREKVNAVVGELDALVWVVDPQQDTLTSLVSYLASFVEDYVGTSGLNCRMVLPRDLPEWPLSSEVRHQVFLAMKEAVHNAVRHARATEIQCRVQFNDGWLEIAILDNGHGFDPAAVQGGNGLANLRERLAALGGRSVIQSQTGFGTTVSLALPLTPSTLS